MGLRIADHLHPVLHLAVRAVVAGQGIRDVLRHPALLRQKRQAGNRSPDAQVGIAPPGGLPDILLACVGGGSNAMGLFHEFINEPSVRMIGIEASGEGVSTGKHAATLTAGRVGVLHGAMSFLLQDEDGQVIEPHSISAGLDYPGVGPEHSYLKEIGRADYYGVTDQEALDAFQLVSQREGIIPALETAHAFAYLETLCPQLQGSPTIVINCSGRGDKDVQTVAKVLKFDGQ